MAAKTVDVSLRTAASPTLSRRVANIIDPKLKKATIPPATPLIARGNKFGLSIKFNHR